jgi:hypothetical protein
MLAPDTRPRIPVVEFDVLAPDAAPTNFKLVVYGLPISEFTTVPGGGAIPRAALERRGLHGYMCSPFMMREVKFTNNGERICT